MKALESGFLQLINSPNKTPWKGDPRYFSCCGCMLYVQNVEQMLPSRHLGKSAP
jgi:hypothetical protein